MFAAYYSTKRWVKVFSFNVFRVIREHSLIDVYKILSKVFIILILIVLFVVTGREKILPPFEQ